MGSKEHGAGFLDLARAVESARWNWLECLKVTRDHDPKWLAFAHGVTYCYPSTIRIVEQWDRDEVLLDYGNLDPLVEWFNDEQLVFRKERLRHASPQQAAECLRSAAQVCNSSSILQLCYKDLWDLVGSVKRFGRYQTIKVCGVLHALGCTHAMQPDIRPRGAKLGRRTLHDLGLIPEEHASVDAVDYAAKSVLDRLIVNGVDMTDNPYLRLESLLCEYQQMKAGRFHADRGLQKDIQDWVAVHGITPGLPMGHLRPWQQAGPFRPILDSVYAQWGYVWSDAVYDFKATRDFADPAVRSDRPWDPRTSPNDRQPARA